MKQTNLKDTDFGTQVFKSDFDTTTDDLIAQKEAQQVSAVKVQDIQVKTQDLTSQVRDDFIDYKLDTDVAYTIDAIKNPDGSDTILLRLLNKYGKEISSQELTNADGKLIGFELIKEPAVEGELTNNYRLKMTFKDSLGEVSYAYCDLADLVKYIDAEITRSTNEDTKLTQNSANKITATHSPQDGVVTLKLFNINNAQISEASFDLDTEKIIKEVKLDYANKKLIFIFRDETEITCDISALIDGLKADIETEKQRAIAAELQLQSNITREENRATAAETTLTTNLNTEINRAKSEESRIEIKLNQEIADRESGKILGEVFAGQPYNLPYYFKKQEEADKIKVTAEVISLDGKKTKAEYSMEVLGASTEKAGLMTSADKVKLDETLPNAINAEKVRAKGEEERIEGKLNTEISERKGLNLERTGNNGKYIKFVAQTAGQLSAETQTFDVSLVGGTDNNAPTTKAVGDYVNRELAATIEASELIEETGKVQLTLKNKNGAIISTALLDLNNEEIIKEIKLNYTSKNIEFILKSGRILKCDISVLIDRLESEITRATNAEAQLNTKIDTEITNRTNAVENEAATRKADDDAIKATIGGLNTTAGVDGSYLKLIKQEAGQVTATPQAFDKVVDSNANDNNAPTTKTVKTFVENTINSLDVEKVGTENQSIVTTIKEVDGKIEATKEERLNSITAETTKLVTEKAVKNYADTLGTNLQTNITAEEIRAKQAETLIDNKVTVINSKIPSEATETNKLADKAFVNSSIENMAAFYITKRIGSEGNYQYVPFDSFADLMATKSTEFYIGEEQKKPGRNDYCIILADETRSTEGRINPTTRYIYTKKNTEAYSKNAWSFQYIINNSGLTQAQLAAVNSGITLEKREGYDAHLLDTTNPHNVTKAQVGLSDVVNKGMDTTVTADSDKYISSGAVKTYVDTSINNLDAEKVGEENTSIISTIKQENGKIISTKEDRLTAITGVTTKLVTEGAIVNYVDQYGGKIDSISINSTKLPIINKDVSIPLATESNYGVVGVASENGINTTNGWLYVEKATQADISNKANNYKPIVPANLDYAIEKGLGNNTLTWTSEEQAKARTTIGLGNVDNTSDINKPISTAQQTALDTKVNKTTNTNKVYATNNTGEQTTLTYTNIKTPETIIYRDENGRAEIVTPISANQIANKDYVDASLNALDLTKTGDVGKYVRWVKQENGQLTAEAISLDTSLEETVDNNNAPTSKAVKDYITSEGGKINKITVNGTEQTITNKTAEIPLKTLNNISLNASGNLVIDKTFVGLNLVENKAMDTTPTDNSTNYISSGGVKSYIDTYGGKIDHIYLNNEEQEIINKTVKLNNIAITNITNNFTANQTITNTGSTPYLQFAGATNYGALGINQTNGPVYYDNTSEHQIAYDVTIEEVGY